MKPLRDARILDLTNLLAGPFCCHQLAHMGADVIKVEAPGGDLARQLGADPGLNDELMGVSFLAQNPGKRSITINLKSEAGKAVFRRLVKTVDVVVENFRPGVMDRLGVGFETLKDENPNLIYCAISGFGQDGPLRNFPAYDQIIQGMSGVMSITGAQDTAPYRVGYPIADSIGGMTAAFAVAAALADKDRKQAAFIDISMLEATMATMGWVISNYLIAGREARPMGNENFTSSPSGTFKTGDGLLNIAANKQEQFEALCRVIGRRDLAHAARFAKRQGRLDNRDELKAEIETSLSAKSALDWQGILNAAGVPAGRVLTVAEALAHPQTSERGLIATFRDVSGVGRDIKLLRTGIKIDGKPPKVDSPPPRLGAHTETILSELDYSPDEILALKEEEAV